MWLLAGNGRSWEVHFRHMLQAKTPKGGHPNPRPEPQRCGHLYGHRSERKTLVWGEGEWSVTDSRSVYIRTKQQVLTCFSCFPHLFLSVVSTSESCAWGAWLVPSLFTPFWVQGHFVVLQLWPDNCGRHLCKGSGAVLSLPVTSRISVPFKSSVLEGLWNPAIPLVFVLLLRKFCSS